MNDTSYTRVGDVMRPSPRVIDGLATVEKAIERMRGENVSSLVVDRRHEGDEYGLVVVADIAEKIIGGNLSPARVNVYEIMSKPVLTVSADMDIKYAIRLLSRFGLSRALVIEDGALAGIVTARDMVFSFLAVPGGGAAPG